MHYNWLECLKVSVSVVKNIHSLEELEAQKLVFDRFSAATFDNGVKTTTGFLFLTLVNFGSCMYYMYI